MAGRPAMQTNIHHYIIPYIPYTDSIIKKKQKKKGAISMLQENSQNLSLCIHKSSADFDLKRITRTTNANKYKQSDKVTKI